MLMNLLLAIFYSNYQEKVGASLDNFKDKRNAFFIRMFRFYDKKENGGNETGELPKTVVNDLTKEIHALVAGADEKSKEIDMTELQFEQVFKLLDKDKSGTLSPEELIDLIVAYETWLYEKQYKNAMEDLYSDSNNQDTLTGDGAGLWDRMLRVISSPQYELFMNIVTIVNVFTVFYYALQQSKTEDQIRRWIILELTINMIMLFETIGDLFISGPIRAYAYHFRIWPETMCQILNMPAMIWFFKAGDNFQHYNYTVKIFEVIVFIRMLKLLTLLYEVQVMRVIFETLKNLLGPLNNLVIVMMTIFYVFAQIGMLMFGGEIRSDSPEIVHDSSIPDNYYLMNFNDLCSAYVTLFVLIVVNNWYVIVAMCVDIK